MFNSTVVDFPRLSDVVGRVVQDVLSVGGSSLSPRTGEPAPATGFAVGGEAEEVTVTEAWLRSTDYDPELLTTVLVAQWGRGILYRETYTYVGGWLNEETGLVHFDVSGHYLDEDIAFAKGRQRGEIAIYDLAKNEEVRL